MFRLLRKPLVAGAVITGVGFGVGFAATANEAPVDGAVTPAELPTFDYQNVPNFENNVVDSRGDVRGRISDRQVELRSGHDATEVVDANGDVVGYLIPGALGFVDLDLAGDPDRLRRLEDCLVSYAATLLADEECTDELRRVGVDPQPPPGESENP